MAESLMLQTLLDLEAKYRAIPRAPRILAVEPPPIYGPRKPHHKKRIAKKWLKRYGKKIIGYDRYLGDKVVMLKDQVGFGGQPVAVCHTDIARRLEFEQWRRSAV